MVRCVVIGVPDRGVRAGVLFPFNVNAEVGVAIVGNNERQRVSVLERVILFFFRLLERGRERVFVLGRRVPVCSRLRRAEGGGASN
jgi:hypothetical protein